MEVIYPMIPTGQHQWPHYTYVIPQICTKAKIRLIGLGSYLPAGIVTNEFFAHISTHLGDPRSADDLERVTGLRTRSARASTLALCRQMVGADTPGLIDPPNANPDESLIDMAVIAAQRAIASAGIDASQIDTVIGVSSSDNDCFPTIAGLVSMRLGLGPVRATMLKGACACQAEGFQVCCEALAAKSANLVLMVVTEGLLPNITNFFDWKTSSLFGEGAAAFLMERGDEDTYVLNGSDARQGNSLFYQTLFRKDVIDMAEANIKIRQLYKEGRGKELSKFLSQHLVGYIQMNGKEVFREAPRAMAESVDALCRHACLSHDELAFIIPHQANSRITRRLGELLINDYGWPASTMDKLVDNFRNCGNLSNASIATAFVELLRQGRLQEGQWIALPAVGGGMNYGCWLLRFQGLRHLEATLNPA